MNCNIYKLHVSLNFLNLNILDNLIKSSIELLKKNEKYIKSKLSNVFLDKFDHFDNDEFINFIIRIKQTNLNKIVKKLFFRFKKLHNKIQDGNKNMDYQNA